MDQNILTITYRGITLFNGHVEDLQWHDLPGEGAVSVVGKQQRKAAPQSGLEALLKGGRSQNSKPKAAGELNA